MRKYQNKRIFAGALLVMLTASAQALEVNDTSKVVDLDEVIVVSQPKEGHRLRLQPLSSTVMTQQEMLTLQVRDLSQLSAFVPSFSMPQYGSRLTSSIYIRGIGSRINNPAVGVYYDHIPLMSKAAFNHHFYLVDRVDVLRGPQGTLYGMNTEGGLVRIYSKDPMSYQGTDISLGVGTGLTSHAEVAHFHRPSDKFAFSVAGFWNGQRGFFKNQALHEWNDKMQEAGGKARLMWTPTDQWKVDLTADYQFTKQNAFPYGVYDVEADKVADPATTLMNQYKRNMLVTGLNVTHTTDLWQLTSTTSYQLLRDQMDMDQDYLPQDFLRLTQKQLQNTVTQEFVLRNRNNAKWQHSTGFFWSYRWLKTQAPVGFMGDFNRQMEGRLNALIPAMMAQAMVAGGMPEAMAQQRIAGMQFNLYDLKMSPVPGLFHTPEFMMGLYHESNINLMERLRLTLGLRYDYSQTSIRYDTEAGMTAMVSMMARGQQMKIGYDIRTALADQRSTSFNQLLPKVGLTWQMADNGSNLYAQLSKGYRAGGYNIQMFSDILQAQLSTAARGYQGGAPLVIENDQQRYNDIAQTIAYKPEESWNYEVGSHLNLFGGKVQADVAAYYMQIRNQQLSVMSNLYNFGRIMVNAGKSHTLGAEVALRGKAFDNKFTWAACYSFTSAKFDEYLAKEGATSSAPVSYKHKYVPFVPQHVFSASADYRLGKLTLGANVAGQGKIWWDEANTFSQKLYATLGAHADYDFGPVVVSLWGRNLTDARYNTFAVESSAAGSKQYFAQRCNPLQAGVDVNIHF